MQLLASEIDEEWAREFGVPAQQRQTRVAANVMPTDGSTVAATSNLPPRGPDPRLESICHKCKQKGHYARDHQADGSIRRTPYQRQATVSASVSSPPPAQSDDLATAVKSISAALATLSSRLNDIEQARAKEDF